MPMQTDGASRLAAQTQTVGRRRRFEKTRNGPVISVVQLFVSILRQYRVLLIISIGGTARVFSQKPNTVSVTDGDFPDNVRSYA